MTTATATARVVLGDLTVIPVPAELGSNLLAEGSELVICTESGSPLRCCLRDAGPGERIVLGPYSPDGPDDTYRETGPVFVHAEPCAGPVPDELPAFWRNRGQILRTYDHRGRISGGRQAAPGELLATAEVLLDDPDVAFIHARNIIHGCFMATIVRTDYPASIDNRSARARATRDRMVPIGQPTRAAASS